MPTESFLDGYIACALWSSNDESDESGGQPFDANYDRGDIAPATLAAMESECETFRRENAALLSAAYEKGYSEAWAGHDFWLTRNGHGAGFWGRDELSGTLGEALSEAARRSGQRDLYLGDDGAIYQFPG